MAVIAPTSKPVVFIGAGDAICSKAIEFFAAASQAPIILADRDEDAIRQATSSLAAGRATTHKVDIFAPSELRSLIQGAALVVLGAQPYYQTSKPVIEACLEARVPYFDFSDDVTSTTESLGLSDRAREQGIPCYINCGASPGLTNLLALDAAKELESVDTIDVCWYVTDRGGENGKEVFEHLMHIAAGPCPTWAEGKPTLHENWVETVFAPVEQDDRDVLLHETIHPEPVTLPRMFPHARRIRCIGALNPAPLNGIARGLAAAVRTGDLPMETAIDFLWNMKTKPAANGEASVVSQGIFGAIAAHLRGGEVTLKELFQITAQTAGSLNPWRFAVGGLIGQVNSGECSVVEVLRFIIDSARGSQVPYRGGMMVRVIGTRDGHPAIVIRRAPSAKQGEELQSMASDIGSCAATFLIMVLESQNQKRAGVLCPEDWADLQTFYKTASRMIV